MATVGLLQHHVHAHQYRPQDSRSLHYPKFTLTRLPHRLAQFYCTCRPLTRCLNHQESSTLLFPARSGAQACNDTEVLDGVNNTAHDPMVEVDPVTVLRRVLAERQVIFVRAREEKGMESTSLPSPFLSGIRRPSDFVISIAMAMVVLAVTVVMYFIRSRKNKDKKKLPISVNGSSSLESIQKLVKEFIKIPDNVMTAMAVGATSLGQTKGHNAIASPSFVKEVQHEVTEQSAVVNSNGTSTRGNHPPFKVENVGRDVTEGPWFSQSTVMRARIEQLECEGAHVESGGLQLTDVTTTVPPVAKCVGGVSVSEVQFKPSLVDGDIYGEEVSANLATKQLVEPNVDSSDSKSCKYEVPLVHGRFDDGSVSADHSAEQLVETNIDSFESDSSESEPPLVNGEFYGEVNYAAEQLVEPKVQNSKSESFEFVDGEFYGEVNLATEQLVEPNIDSSKSESSEVYNTMHTVAVKTAEVKYNLENMHLIEGKSVTVLTQQVLFECANQSMESASQDPNFLNSPSSQQVCPTEEEGRNFCEENMDQVSLCDTEEKQLLDGSMNSHLQNSAAEGNCVEDGALEDPAEDVRQEGLKAVEAAVPALVIGAGTVGTLFGVAGGLQVVGFAALVSFISREFLWAQSRESLLQELSDITDRQKLLHFLRRRNIVIQERGK